MVARRGSTSGIGLLMGRVGSLHDWLWGRGCCKAGVSLMVDGARSWQLVESTSYPRAAVGPLVGGAGVNRIPRLDLPSGGRTGSWG